MMHNNLFKLCIHTLFCNLFLLFILNLQHISNTASASSVKFLPGFDGPLPFELETGYIGVGESEDVQLFYYFIKSERNPGKDPLLLWLTGGPGCSALSGILYEIGPIKFVLVDYHGSLPKLVLNPYSWTKVANIIFIDLPVGTGFSYARNTKAAHSDDLLSSDHAYEFLRKWLVDHPQFISNQFYVTGDSYSGITVPILMQLISDGNDIGLEPKINLKGYLIGNPVTCPADGDYVAQFAHGMGLIPDELFESLKETCKGVFHGIDPNNRICLQNMQTLDKLLGNIKPSYILDFYCPIDAPKPNKLLGDTRRIMYEKDHSDLMKLELQKDSPFKCRTDEYMISYQWANDESVQEAIHVHKGTVGQWKRCNHDSSFTKSVINVVSYHANLSIKGYRSLIYSGDHDLIVPFISTEAWIKSLNYSIVDDWRPWNVDGQVAGYTRTYANKMTYATVKGAGHTAPEYKPRECRLMFEKWMSYQPL